MVIWPELYGPITKRIYLASRNDSDFSCVSEVHAFEEFKDVSRFVGVLLKDIHHLIGGQVAALKGLLQENEGPAAILALFDAYQIFLDSRLLGRCDTQEVVNMGRIENERGFLEICAGLARN